MIASLHCKKSLSKLISKFSSKDSIYFIRYCFINFLFFFCIFVTNTQYIKANAKENAQQPIATDSRIKTFVFSENEVFPIVLHYGYQTALEFGIGEIIQTYSVGNNYAWQFNNVGRTLFIKPMEENIITNMTVITNKHRYYFELQSKMASYDADQDLAFAIRFFYPDDEDDTVKPTSIIASNKVIEKPAIPAIQPYNFNYIVSGPVSIAPTVVFDDGANTYFQYENNISAIPNIAISNNKKLTNVNTRKVGNYLVVNQLAKDFELKLNNDTVKVTASN